MVKYPVGSIHGRFQPLHKGHLIYLLSAKERCDFLRVGITQYDINSLLDSPRDPHRQKPENNPLTYSERVDMISQVLLDEGLKLDEFDIIPFPIETPEKLQSFLPTNIPIFTTVCQQWNRYKIEVLTKIGYEVIVLWEDEDKEFDGIKIRNLICEGDDKWKQQVPPATAKTIKELNIRDRIIRLRSYAQET